MSGFRALVLCCASMVGAACSPVSQVHVRGDYELLDRTRTHRVKVVSAPLPSEQAVVGQLWSLQSARYMNHHRDFIAWKAESHEAVPQDACADESEAVLLLESARAEIVGSSVALKVRGLLSRCSDGAKIWSASIEGAWPSNDDQLKELTASYVRELGDVVSPWAAPSFRMVRLLLDTLPKPALEDDDKVMEKIELDL